MSQREAVQIIDGQPTSDGAGVRLVRSLGTALLPQLDPFLMLDEFRSDRADDYLAGFPDHPHRGFETVTYMLAGVMEHKDSVGNTGRLVPGGAQWMTAGRGIIHSEMPKQKDGLMWGFQLWVNLPADRKMSPPRYQDITPDAIPMAKIGDAEVRVVAGRAGGVEGPVQGVAVAPTMLDVKLPPGARLEQPIDEAHNAFLYVFEGSVRIGRDDPVPRGKLIVLGEGSEVVVTSDAGGRFLLLAGRPIGEPVARYGPFVMNTQAEIRQAITDYQAGRLARRA